MLIYLQRNLKKDYPRSRCDFKCCFKFLFQHPQCLFQVFVPTNTCFVPTSTEFGSNHPTDNGRTSVIHKLILFFLVFDRILSCLNNCKSLGFSSKYSFNCLLFKISFFNSLILASFILDFEIPHPFCPSPLCFLVWWVVFVKIQCH